MSRTHPITTRLMAAILVAVTTFAGVAVPRASAAPDATPVVWKGEPTTAKAGPVRLSVSAEDPAVPVGGTFSYQATVRTAQPASFVQVRMRLFMPETRTLVYQKTFIQSAPESRTISFTFERTLADIDLKPGAYPFEVTARVAAGGGTHDVLATGDLRVYDTKKPRLPVALVARVSAVPLSGPDGAFVADPSRYTRARDDVTELCGWVLENPGANLSLVLSPIMLEEWQRISRGYRYVGPEGTIRVGEDSEVALSYSSALKLITAAEASGRLELLSTSYSDPNLSELAAAKLLDDIAPQYELGVSTCFAAVESTPSPGTAPFSGAMSEAAGTALVSQGLEYTVVRSKWTRSGKVAASPGAYRAQESPLRVLVSDDSTARAIASSPTAEVLRRAYDHYLETSATPLPLSVTVGPGKSEARMVTTFAEAVNAQPWAALTLARDAASAPKKPARVTLVGSAASKKAPAGHWDSIATARRWADALTFAIGANADESDAATRHSLVAEGSAWSGTNGGWEHAERAQAFAMSAERTSRDILEKITVSAKPVTLAGTTGEVPLTIANGTGRKVRVRLETMPSSGMRLSEAATREIVLQPQENFIEVPVDLRNSLSGSLRVRLFSSRVEVAGTTVALKASIIDRLAILGGIVILLVALLAFIITRVRAAEGRDVGRGNRRYT